MEGKKWYLLDKKTERVLITIKLTRSSWKMIDERGWINFRQPSQSPVLNTCDACYFPMASKTVSREKDYHSEDG